MHDDAQQMEGSRIFGISLAGRAIETLSLEQPPRLMMSHRRGKRAIRSAAGGHADISNTEAAAISDAGPVTSKGHINFAAAAIDPDRLIARQRVSRDNG